MSKFEEITLADVGRTVARYRPFIGVVVGVLLVVAFLPGAQRAQITATGGAPGGTATDGGTQVGGDGDSTVDTSGEDPSATPGTVAGGSGATATSGGAGGSGSGGGAGTATSSAGSGGGGTAAGGDGTAMVANCDPATGRIAIPSRFSPPCVPAFTGDNGGATYQGVSDDKIKIAWYEVREDPATNAVLTAAGVNDSTEEQRQQVRDWVELYEFHFETYGRNAEIHFVPASGGAEDDAAARADAIKIAEEIKAFAALNGPSTNVFVEELVARGVMCMCTVSQPIESYIRWSPYVWSTLAASSQLYLHRSEYVGKRLHGRNAKWAGDPLLQQERRTFAILYYDTDDQAYKPGVDFFVKTLRDKYGIRPTATVEYHGYPNVARSQEEARPAIQKLKDSGATSIICVCDPFGPIFMTQEATRQLYRPEWIITGSALTDTAFFARLYDQTQWTQAFGVSALPGRMPERLQDDFRVYNWHFQREPVADGRYGVIRDPIDLLYYGIHMAGPNLNPETFKQGMWNLPTMGDGGITTVSVSFGPAGRVWPWDDYLAFDDMTEIWWDENAEGEDEIGQDGRGLYRYVDMGKRYLAGQWPDSDPRVFDPANTATIYEEPPPQDRWPEYPPPNRG